MDPFWLPLGSIFVGVLCPILSPILGPILGPLLGLFLGPLFGASLGSALAYRLQKGRPKEDQGPDKPWRAIFAAIYEGFGMSLLLLFSSVLVPSCGLLVPACPLFAPVWVPFWNPKWVPKWLPKRSLFEASRKSAQLTGSQPLSLSFFRGWGFLRKVYSGRNTSF